MTERTHDDSKRDIDSVISGPSSVRESSDVACSNTERMLACARRRSDRRVETQHFSGHDASGLVQSREAGQERSHEVIPREVRWREVRDVGAQRLVNGIAEQQIQNKRQSRVGDELQELTVVFGLAGIETVLALDANDEFVDQR